MRLQLILAAVAAVPVLGATSAFGQNETWDGDGASDDWTDGTNWLDDTAPPDPNNNQFHLFGAGGISKLATDMNATDFVWEFGQLQFAASGYSINSSNSSTMSLSGFNNGNIITNTTGSVNTVNVPIVLNSANTTNTAGNANLRTIDTAGTSAVTLNGTLTANADAGRNFNVRKIGSGSLTLNASNAITGTFEATNGVTRLGNNLALGTSTVVVANGSANTVRYTSDTAAPRTLANNFTISGAGVLAFGESGTGDMTLNGTFALANSVKPIAVLGGSTATINGVISGAGALSGITKNNPGTLILTSSNTYEGLTTVGNGTLQLNGSVAGDTNVGGGTLDGTGSIGGGLGVFDIDLADALAGGTLSPGTGTTVGTLNGTTAAFGTGGNYLYNIASPASTDLLALTGALTAAATADNPFGISVTGTGFVDAASQQYTLVDGAAAVVGFDASKFTLNTAAFAPGATGTFSLGLSPDNTNLILNYTAVPEPGTLVLAGLVGVGLLSRRRNRVA